MSEEMDDLTIAEQKRTALAYLAAAWDGAVAEGIDSEIVAHAALFRALADLVQTYGEDAVAELANGLSDRVRRNEFTVSRAVH